MDATVYLVIHTLMTVSILTPRRRSGARYTHLMLEVESNSWTPSSADDRSLQSTDTTTGGRIWPQYIQQYTGINLYDYAVSGAVCDTAFAPSTRSGVKQNQMPSFLQDHAYVGNGSLVDAANETIL